MVLFVFYSTMAHQVPDDVWRNNFAPFLWAPQLNTISRLNPRFFRLLGPDGKQGRNTQIYLAMKKLPGKTWPTDKKMPFWVSDCPQRSTGEYMLVITNRRTVEADGTVSMGPCWHSEKFDNSDKYYTAEDESDLDSECSMDESDSDSDCPM